MIGTLVLSIGFLGTSVNAFASQPEGQSSDQTVISIEEYASALKEEYSQYGIKYEVINEDTDVVLTKKILEEQLLVAKQQGEEYLQEQKSNLMEREMLEKSMTESNAYFPMVMYVKKTYKDYQVVNSPSKMGMAQICLEGQATADADKGYFLWANYGKSYQKGPYVNFKSWSEDSADCSIYTFPGTSTKMLALFVNGTLTVEYTEAKSGLQVGYSSDHALNVMWAY